MELTKKQLEGLNIAVGRYKMGEPYTVISGYAGAGKSTLIKFIIDALNLPRERVAYVAYTGKAAKVLKQKGCPNATTAHKLLYYAKPLPNGQYVFTPKKTLDGDYKLIVVDEVSMLPKDMWLLLLRHKIYVLATGDPGQLPPINKDQANNVLDHPHVFLDEIMRQAQDSAIIRLSMLVREGGDFRNFENVPGEVRIIKNKQEFYNNYEDYKGCLCGASQILCATNRMRENLNKTVRSLQGRGPEPEIGDKVIGLTNHWDELSMNYNPLTNGSIGTISSMYIEEARYPKKITEQSIKLLCSDIYIEDDDDTFFDIPIDYQHLTTGSMSVDNNTLYRIRNYVRNTDKEGYKIPYEFSYGYAITCWKAQGSEWDDILFFEENFPVVKQEHIQYLYTGITRASNKLILVAK